MEALTRTEIDYLTPIVEAQAKRVAARYEGIETDDLAQEVWVWLVEESSPALRGYVAADQAGRVAKSLYNAAVTWCERDRKRKLREAGIDWRDEYNYSRPEVARLLPMALDYGAIPALAGRELSDMPGAKADPAYSNDILASLIDVRNAFGALSGADQDYVRVVIGLDSNWSDIAACTGVQANSAYAKWMRILDRMVTRHLGRKVDDESVAAEGAISHGILR